MSPAAEGAGEGVAGGGTVDGVVGVGVCASATEANKTHIHLIGQLIGWNKREL
jgi:hypothetical protein